LITSENPTVTIKRLQEITSYWHSINTQITFKETPNGISFCCLSDINPEEQRQLFRQIQQRKYPLILVIMDESLLDKKLQTQLLFDYYDNIEAPVITSFRLDDLEELRERVNSTVITTEVKTYIYDLVIELRYSRFVKGGLPTYLLFDLRDFIKFKARILKKSFVTPVLVKECFKQVLSLRLRLIEPEEDLTLMYGSNPALINQLVKVINVNDVLDIAISHVKPPI
jgi:MoxR-like ATPase